MAGLSLSAVDVREFQPQLASFDDVQPVVAIVDNDIGIRQSLERLIGGRGWLPLAFTSGQEFLHHASQSCPPNCLILELSLPDMSGLTLQELILPRMSHTP